MASGKFYFNATLLRYDLRRFWPCAALILLVAVLVLPVTMATTLSDRAAYAVITIEDTSDMVTGVLPVVLMGALAMGLVVAVLVSRYLFTARSVNFYHGLPLRREGLLLTNVTTGLCLLWTPVLLTAVITGAVELSFGALDLVSLGQLLLVYVCTSLLFFALGMFCCQVTGMTAAAVGLFGVLNIIFYAGYAIFSTLMELFVVGYTTNTAGVRMVLWLTPFVNLYSSLGTQYVAYRPEQYTLARLSGLHLPLIYAAVGVALLALVLLLCRHRKSERAGDLLAFGWLRPVFKVGFSLGVGAGLSLMTIDMYDLYAGGFVAVVLVLVAWSLVCWLAAEMLVRKSPRVFQRRVFAQWAVTALCALVLLAGMRLDVFGVERRVPAADQVAQAQISVNGRYANLLNPQPAIDLHQQLVDHREELRRYEESTTAVSFTYTMTDGSTLERVYHVRNAASEAEMDDLQRAVNDCLTDPAQVIQFYFDGGLDTPQELKQLSVEYYDEARGVYDTLPLTSDQTWTLYQAVAADIEQGNLVYATPLNQALYEDQYTQRVNVSIDLYYLPAEVEAQLLNRHDPGGVSWRWCNIDVLSTMTNTIACLESLGWTQP